MNGKPDSPPLHGLFAGIVFCCRITGGRNAVDHVFDDLGSIVLIGHEKFRKFIMKPAAAAFAAAFQTPDPKKAFQTVVGLIDPDSRVTVFQRLSAHGAKRRFFADAFLKTGPVPNHDVIRDQNHFLYCCFHRDPITRQKSTGRGTKVAGCLK